MIRVKYIDNMDESFPTATEWVPGENFTRLVDIDKKDVVLLRSDEIRRLWIWKEEAKIE
jgi:hypothetical protein